MKRNQESDKTVQNAIENIRWRGRIAGLTTTEISEIESIIREGMSVSVSDADSITVVGDPVRMAFLAFEEYRARHEVWYKPWIAWRFNRIAKNYCEVWFRDQIVPEVHLRFIG